MLPKRVHSLIILPWQMLKEVIYHQPSSLISSKPSGWNKPTVYEISFSSNRKSLSLSITLVFGRGQVMCRSIDWQSIDQEMYVSFFFWTSNVCLLGLLISGSCCYCPTVQVFNWLPNLLSTTFPGADNNIERLYLAIWTDYVSELNITHGGMEVDMSNTTILASSFPLVKSWVGATHSGGSNHIVLSDLGHTPTPTQYSLNCP
jgi:hypothetical protein